MQKIIRDSLSPQTAWRILGSHPPLRSELRQVAEAIDYCLAVEFIAPENVPSGPRSFMDGYAVRSADVAGIPSRLKKTGEVLMGKMPEQRIREGEAMAIPTGGFLPNGADAVVMQEDTEIENDLVLIRRTVSENENVQMVGEDFVKGTQIFPPGHRLRAQDLSVIATFGITEVNVVRKPRISIISTGNELVPYNEHAGPAQIRETNSLALRNAAAQFGFHTRTSGIIPDELPLQRSAMEREMQHAEVLLISGGSSVGARDLTMDAIQTFSPNEVFFHGLAIRPGNPTIFARAGSSWIFGLPGQPVSSLVVFYQFVLPFLLHLSGEKIDYAVFHETHFRTVNAKLSKEVKPLKAKTDYLRVKLKQTDKECIAVPVLGKSASLSTLAMADGFAIVPPGEEILREGSLLKVYLFP